MSVKVVQRSVTKNRLCLLHGGFVALGMVGLRFVIRFAIRVAVMILLTFPINLNRTLPRSHQDCFRQTDRRMRTGV